MGRTISFPAWGETNQKKGQSKIMQNESCYPTLPKIDIAMENHQF